MLKKTNRGRRKIQKKRSNSVLSTLPIVHSISDMQSSALHSSPTHTNNMITSTNMFVSSNFFPCSPSSTTVTYCVIHVTDKASVRITHNFILVLIFAHCSLFLLFLFLFSVLLLSLISCWILCSNLSILLLHLLPFSILYFSSSYFFLSFHFMNVSLIPHIASCPIS